MRNNSDVPGRYVRDAFDYLNSIIEEIVEDSSPVVADVLTKAKKDHNQSELQ